MAENEIEVDAPPEAVWEVLARPGSYDEWVMGAQAVRDADEHWPEVGAKLHHRSGVGPLSVDDETEVVGAERPSRLALRANVGPLGSFDVVLRLTPSANGGTTVIMQEEPVKGLATHVPGTDVAIGARNAISLERLKQLAEETTAADR